MSKLNCVCVGGLRPIFISFAIFTGIVIASAAQAQSDDPGGPRAAPTAIGTAQRVPSSQEPATKVDPATQAQRFQFNDYDDNPLLSPERNPLFKADPSIQFQYSIQDGLLIPNGADQLSPPDAIFNGINSGSNPPDTVGDVGPNHYIHMTNPNNFQVFEHDGTTTGVVTLDSLWPAGDACRNGRGDPIVVYDHLADRWVMLQFAWAAFDGSGNPVAPFFLCFALSTSATPDTVPGNWYLWTINTGNAFPDYPKVGVWPDAYYMSTHEGDSGVFALDRANMLNGNALQWVKFTLTNPPPAAGVRNTRVLPADVDGPPPPAGTPGVFLRTVEDSQDIGDPDDRLEIYEFDVNWANPAASTFTMVDDLRGAQGLLDFEIMVCNRAADGGNGAARDCVPVPGAGASVDALSNRPMMQLKFRNFGSHQAMVVNQTVDVAPALNALNPGLGFTVMNEVAGIRWYELRRDDSGDPWDIYQQGTYAPQNNPADEGEILHRWMGSAAMDGFGNIVLGYSVSSDDVVHPGIRYAGRTPSDPFGLLPQSEFSIVEGTTSPNGEPNRWGDYSAMSVDPMDDCTFWYTTHLSGGEAQRTRIANFRFNACSTDLEVSKSANPDPATAGQQITYTVYVSNYGPLDATSIVVVDSLPDGFVYLADSVPGDECDVAGQTVTCEIGDLAPNSSTSFTITAAIDSDILQVPDGPTTFDNLVEGSAAEADANEDNNAFTLSTLVNESADLAVQKICKPDEPAIAGEEEGHCEIIITNHGPSMARNATLDDEIVANGNYTITSIIDDDGATTCIQSSGDVECDLGDIDAGEVITVTVYVTTDEAIDINDLATVTSDTPDPDTSNNSDEGSITFVVALADVIVTKQCQPVTPAPAATDAFCEIFVFNNGPSTAEDVQLDDQIASDGNYQVTAITTTAGSCVPGVLPAANSDVVCDLNDILEGDTVTVVVTFTTNDEVDVDDIATATSVTQDPDPNNNTATGSVSYQGIADLSITKTENVDPVAAGTNLSYTLMVQNAGPSTAVNVVVSDVIPGGTTVGSAMVTVGTGSCVIGVAGDPLRPTECGLGAIPSGGNATVEIVTAVLPGATGVLHNDARVSSDTYDANNNNNQVTEDTAIEVVTDLVLLKTANTDPVTAGSELKYVLSLTNNGPSTATDVILVDNLPVETDWVDTKVLGGVGDCLLSSTNPDIVTCTLNDMNPGENFLVVITVVVDPSTPDGTTITNEAIVTESSGPGTTADVDVLVNALADLWIDKVGLFLTDVPSRTIRYTLTVHNDSGCSGDDPQVCGDGGPSDAQDVVVFDDLPSTNRKLVVTYVSEDCLYDYDSHTVTCTTPTLAAGDTVFHEIEARPKGSLRAITNTADVSSSTTDPDAGNNTDDFLIVVGGGGNK